MQSKPNIKIFLGIVAVVCFGSLAVFFLTSNPTTDKETNVQASSLDDTAAVLTPPPAPFATFPAATLAPADQTVNALAAPAATVASVAPQSQQHGTAFNRADAAQKPLPSGQHLQLAGLPVTLYVPQSVQPQQPVQLLIALHGMYGNGAQFCQGLVNFAEQNHIMLLAPTFKYNPNYKSPQIIISEDVNLTAKLNEMVGELGTVTHLPIKGKLLLYGFSRGAQLAHHYAMLYPNHTLGVTVFAGGAYTLPFAETKADKDLPFPLGVGDISQYTGKEFDEAAFAKVPFNIEVGQNDIDPSGVSRYWDSYLGTTRLARAQSYYEALKQIGDNVKLTVFPHTVHEVSIAENALALKFFQGLLAA